MRWFSSLAICSKYSVPNESIKSESSNMEWVILLLKPFLYSIKNGCREWEQNSIMEPGFVHTRPQVQSLTYKRENPPLAVEKMHSFLWGKREIKLQKLKTPQFHNIIKSITVSLKISVKSFCSWQGIYCYEIIYNLNKLYIVVSFNQSYNVIDHLKHFILTDA